MRYSSNSWATEALAMRCRQCTFTKSARARTAAALILFPTRCRSGRLWYDGPNAVTNAIGYAMHSSRSHDAVIRVYDEAGNVIETHEHKGEFKEW
jgi:hypothetical protein